MKINFILSVKKGYSLYSNDVSLILEGIGFPRGTSILSSMNSDSVGSGFVLPIPIQLCFPDGNFSMYSDALYSTLN